MIYCVSIDIKSSYLKRFNRKEFLITKQLEVAMGLPWKDPFQSLRYIAKANGYSH